MAHMAVHECSVTQRTVHVTEFEISTLTMRQSDNSRPEGCARRSDVVVEVVWCSWCTGESPKSIEIHFRALLKRTQLLQTNHVIQVYNIYESETWCSIYSQTTTASVL